MKLSRFEREDPFVARETEKYGRAIPSREYIHTILEGRKRAASSELLIKTLEIEDPSLQEAFVRRLNAMVREGEICQTDKGYLPAEYIEAIEGVIQFGTESVLLQPYEDEATPIAILNSRGHWWCEGDEALVHVTRTTESQRFGVFVRMLKWDAVQILGRYMAEEGGVNTVLSYDKQITGEIGLLHGSKRAKEGEIVLVQIDRVASQEEAQWCGSILKVLGDRSQPGIEVQMAIEKHHIPHVWPPAVEKACEKWSEEVPKTAYRNRTDLRTLPLVTIDGEDAKDFDDAVFCEPRSKGGWRLVVAIADVSHYVRPHTALDKEAEWRGNSVYFPGSVIPMLPEILSNGLCSLKPAVDRLCVVCDMVINTQGKVVSYEFYNAVMHSHARLTYNEVANVLEGNKRLRLQYGPLVGMLQELKNLYQALHAAREVRGAIAFETVDTQFLFDEKGQIEKIIPRTRNDAHKIIEECMLCANVSAARFLQKHKMPTLYRVHEGPNASKLIDLHRYLSLYGLRLKGGDKPTPADYNELVHQIMKRPDYKVLQTMLLRSLMQAVYTPNNQGHFGLAYNAYLHFTSPIRRYPDLLVHRGIKALIDSPEAAESLDETDVARFGEMAEHCSLTERIADDATRDVTQGLKCRYMVDRVGEVFTATVTSVVPFGLFMEIEDMYVEGLIHVSQLGDDYFVYDAVNQRMVGEHSKTIYTLGDTFKVRLIRVDLDTNRMDLQKEEVFEKGRSVSVKPSPSSKKPHKKRVR